MDHCQREKRKINPRETANIFSLVTFVYTISLFRKALKKDLEEGDLYEVLEGCKSKDCGDKCERQWRKQKNPSIFITLFSIYGLRYTIIATIFLAWTITRSVLEPYATGHLLSCFKKGQKEMNQGDALYYASLVIGLKVFACFYWPNTIVIEQKLCIQIRTSLSSLLYRKALKLTPKALSKVSLGNIVTLITKDAHTIEESMWVFSDGVIGIIQTSTICYLLYNKIGAAGFVGVGFILCVLPIQVLVGIYITKLRLRTGKRTDERIQLSQEILSAIRIVKMYTWERFFINRITKARRIETKTMMVAFCQRIILIIIGTLSSRIGFYLVIITYIWMGYTTSTELIYYVLTIFRELQFSLGVFIPTGMGKGAEFIAAMIRICKVLTAKEFVIPQEPYNVKPKIQLQDVSLKIQDNMILNDVSLDLTSGLTVVTGFVASGKSSLLKIMLQYYSPTKGDVKVHGGVSYASQEPWLFPSTIKQNILFGQLYDETRYKEVIRVCALKYDLDLLSNGDETIITDRGMNLSKGQQARINLARAIYRKSDIYLLDDSLTALDAHVQDFIFKECIRNFLIDKICVLVSQSKNVLEKADKLVILNKGCVNYCGNPSLKEVENVVKELHLESEKPNKLTNGIVQEISDEDELLLKAGNSRKEVYFEQKQQGRVSWMVYRKYFKFGGGLAIFFVMMAIYSSGQFAENYSDKLLSQWVDLQQKVLDFKTANETNMTVVEETITNNKYTINLYSIMIFTAIALTLIKSYMLFNFCRKASVNIFAQMLSSIINAVMSFFDTHFIGNILNRFSQDLDKIDEELPFIFSECIGLVFQLVGAVVLISGVNYKLIIPSVVLFVGLVLMRIVYLKAGRSLKRLESATRSPIVGYVNASLEGITTIRAFKAEEILREEFDRHQDLYTTARYVSLTTDRAFSFFTDVITTCTVISFIFLILFGDNDISAGDAGLALTQMMLLAVTIQWGIINISKLENLMTSVERALEYTDIKTENRNGFAVEDWPLNGEIRFEKVSLWFKDSEKVLSDVSFTVEPKEKIGIVGRTGAGKSSIISLLFRLYEYEGRITIDGIDIRTLPLDLVRKSIAIIPQDPTIFTGTIRTNLDPKLEYNDQEIWGALKKVQLDTLIDNLEVEIKDSQHFFSTGQKQLMCLARAIIHRSRIVVLDEATANMDPETEVLLQEVIRENFSNSTMITIAHRMNAILDCNRVMVLNKGEIMEYDKPGVLLEDKESWFNKMVEQSGFAATID